MGHYIRTDDFSTKTSKAEIQAECDDFAIREGDYDHGIDPIRWLERPTYTSYEEAAQAIEKLDKGWYDCLAVKYKDDRQGAGERWLVKYEFHC